MRFPDFLMVMFATLVAFVVCVVYATGTGLINIEFQKGSFEQELLICESEKADIISSRDVYCAREFLQPDKSMNYLGMVLLVFGCIVYMSSLLFAHKKLNDLQKVKK